MIKKSFLRFETESLICYAQEQVLMTNWRKIICGLNKTNANCKLCNSNEETIMHIEPGFPALTNNRYTRRHNKVYKYIHKCIFKEIEAQVSDKWYL